MLSLLPAPRDFCSSLQVCEYTLMSMYPWYHVHVFLYCMHPYIRVCTHTHTHTHAHIYTPEEDVKSGPSNKSGSTKTPSVFSFKSASSGASAGGSKASGGVNMKKFGVSGGGLSSLLQGGQWASKSQVSE